MILYTTDNGSKYSRSGQENGKWIVIRKEKLPIEINACYIGYVPKSRISELKKIFKNTEENDHTKKELLLIIKQFDDPLSDEMIGGIMKYIKIPNGLPQLYLSDVVVTRKQKQQKTKVPK